MDVRTGLWRWEAVCPLLLSASHVMSFFSFSLSVRSSVSLFLSFLHHVAQAGILLPLCYISDLCARSVLSGPLF